MELPSDEETEEERLERERRNCEWLCECENKEAGDLNEVDGYNCKHCNNKGYIAKPQCYRNSYNVVHAPCKCVAIRKTIRALNNSGLADVVKEYTFDKYIAKESWQQTILNTAKDYLSDDKEHWFFMGGATGAGKSHICTAVAITLLKRGKEVKYMLWRDEASRLKAMVNEPEYETIVKHYKTVDVLYIDDLFKTGKSENSRKQRPTQGDINLAFEILNARYISKKLTIISSESTLSDLIDIDEAIAGRIKQKCGKFCLNIAPEEGRNYRLK